MGKTVQEMNIGDTASFTKSVTDYDVYSMAGITGDFNPAHINTLYAVETPFKERIAHGVLSVSLISGVLGTQLPGPGVIFIGQVCDFKRPVYVGDTITATVEVVRKDEARNRVWLRTYCTNQRGELVMDGEAEMRPPRKING
ncbi:MAG TPA: MaoC family dehydratase [Syntrophomonadaceae bacterium]|jgi:3-hydroxybutyryl-CoA dehydratase|nr:MaoC family dehydratase [Syntrophomonadaceae bacterium]